MQPGEQEPSLNAAARQLLYPGGPLEILDRLALERGARAGRGSH